MPTGTPLERRNAALIALAVLTGARIGALATFREALDAGREVDANTLAKLGFALLYDLAAPRAAIAVFSACAARFPSLSGRFQRALR